jgi:uncharacterized protein
LREVHAAEPLDSALRSLTVAHATRLRRVPCFAMELTAAASLRALADLALVLVIVGAVLCAVLIYAMARMLLRPPRMTDGKAMYFLKRLSPEDLGLAFDEVSFDVRDERDGGKLKIAGWWIPAAMPSDRFALLIHGYADAKVGGIAWAPLLHSLGFNVLAIDLRAHGESGGVESTAGFWERHDVGRVLDQIRSQRPKETRQAVLFGVSLGAAVAAAVAAERTDVSAVILESPFADYRSAVAAHAKLMGMPGGVFVMAAMAAAEWVSGADFDAVRPVDTIPRIKAPVMVIASGDDPLVGETAAARLNEAVKQRGEGSIHWSVPEAYHVEGMRGDFQEYRQRVAAFLGIEPCADQANIEHSTSSIEHRTQK